MWELYKGKYKKNKMHLFLSDLRNVIYNILFWQLKML